jgi:DNA-binding response OmpR family regulator
MARILIVEDMDTVARLLAHYLREAGHVPMVAPDGHGALRAARAHPDLILLDLGLPDISGDEVLRCLKRDTFTAQIPVVIVSGEPDAADRVPRGGVTGAVAVLQKPVSGSEICAVVDLVLEGRSSDTVDAPGATFAGSGPLDRQQRELLYRLLSTGSDPLVRQIFRRLDADRLRRHKSTATQAPSWRDLARAGRQEGLLNDGEGALLAAGPTFIAASH